MSTVGIILQSLSICLLLKSHKLATLELGEAGLSVENDTFFLAKNKLIESKSYLAI